ncbi:hypothetical protein I6B53_00075 [Schaalia sp. 19OD2882]|uniref:TetR/AcrR family transcriptional regulator n=1 Tax=Schaalia sp. 19OD2882 TaxID=2794089 RepID=UPI001C1EE68E|nr:TetR/AcrR family transcriptional regulator [Schaalia sp. 19OD2882]QWW19586.1 hypothetical protein I6B53_00075 [Schaalia sp. 19OD2882]
MTPSTRKTPGAADRIIDAALKTLSTEGLEVGLENIRMEEAIAVSGVSRATAYRRWPSRQEFLTDVLVAAVTRTDLIPEGEEDIRLLMELVEARMPRLHLDQERRDLVVEALRFTLDADIKRLMHSRQWRTAMSLSALHPTLEPASVRDQVGVALREADRRLDTSRAAIYRNLASMIGYRPVIDVRHGEEDAFDSLARAAGVMMKGVLLRALPDPGWIERRQRVHLFGCSHPLDWSEPERMLVQLLLSHLEPDPDLVWDQQSVRVSHAALVELVRTLYGRVPGDAGEADPVTH